MSVWPSSVHAYLVRRVSTQWDPTPAAGTPSPVGVAITLLRMAHVVKVDAVTINISFLLWFCAKRITEFHLYFNKQVFLCVCVCVLSSSPLLYRCRRVSHGQCVRQSRLCEPCGIIPLWVQKGLQLQQHHETVWRYFVHHCFLFQF